jgi:hypothetical protein
MGRLFAISLAAALVACAATADAVPPHKAHRRTAVKGTRAAAHHIATHAGVRHAGHHTTSHIHPVAHLRSATLDERVPAEHPDADAPDETAPGTAETDTLEKVDTTEKAETAARDAKADLAAAPAPASLRIPRTPVAPLRGSRESLVRQNEMSDAEGLERIEDADDLRDRIERKLLVPVPVSAGLAVNASLPADLRYCRPWTATFLSDMAKAHESVFHRPLMVSSAVRTVEYQKELERVNGNAAPAEGDVVSPHLTGGTIDIAKAELPRQELNWMRAWLKRLEADGKIDVEEEFQQACFHITVYKSYVPPVLEAARKPGAKPKAKRHPAVANALAARVM